MNIHSPITPQKPTKRDAVLVAALTLFSARGFDGTSVPDVAKQAGVGAGTIYRYFASKEELVNVLYKQWKETLMSRLLTEFDFQAPPRQQFHELWTRLSAFAADHPKAFSFLELHHHARYLDEESRTLEENSLRPVVSFVESTRARGITRSMSAEALIALVWGAFVGLIKAQNLGHLTLTPELVLQTEQCVWAAIRAPTANDESI